MIKIALGVDFTEKLKSKRKKFPLSKQHFRS